MNKNNLYKVMYGIAAALVVIFGVKTGIDFYHYDSLLNSAPFYVFVLANAMEFVLPAALLAVFASIFRKKNK